MFGLVSVTACVLYVILHCIVARRCPELPSVGGDPVRSSTPESDSMMGEMKSKGTADRPLPAVDSEAPLVPDTPTAEA